MKSSERAELREPVHAFAARLRRAEPAIPLADLAGLFGADAALRQQVNARGDLSFRDDVFSNDGPEMVLPAGRVELEIPSLLRGTWASDEQGFRLTFPRDEFSVSACVTIAILRKCFALKELRATASDLVLDFGSDLADRRYTF